MKRYNNLSKSITIVSLENGLIIHLTSSANSSTPDFISSGKSFMNIKNNKGPRVDPTGPSKGILCFSLIVCNFYI